MVVQLKTAAKGNNQVFVEKTRKVLVEETIGHHYWSWTSGSLMFPMVLLMLSLMSS